MNYAYKLFHISVTLTIIIFARSAAGGSETHYDQISRGVIRLFTVSASSDSIGLGSGFIVEYKDAGFLVTARHVIVAKSSASSRVTVESIDRGAVEVIELVIPGSDWISHPQTGDSTTLGVDIAVARLTGPEGYNPTHFPEANLEGLDPSPPDWVITYGFPGTLGILKDQQRPIARMGVVSSEAGDKLVDAETGKHYDSLTMLVDIIVQSGNSGGPVLRQRLNGKFDLLGVMTAKVTGGLAIMEPLSRIREAIEYAYANPVESISNVTWRKIK